MRAALAVLLAATSLCMLAAARKSPSQWGSMKDRDWDEVEKGAHVAPAARAAGLGALASAPPTALGSIERRL